MPFRDVDNEALRLLCTCILHAVRQSLEFTRSMFRSLSRSGFIATWASWGTRLASESDGARISRSNEPIGTTHTDVIVIGAGVVGLSVARELASKYNVSVKVTTLHYFIT